MKIEILGKVAVVSSDKWKFERVGDCYQLGHISGQPSSEEDLELADKVFNAIAKFENEMNQLLK